MTGGAIGCPLCDGRDARTVADVPFEAIWAALNDERGVSFDPEVVTRHTPADSTQLRECSGCGLQYFSPSIPGDAAFYERLGQAGYYEPSRWEFGVAAAAVRADDNVLDIGCGRGDF